MSRIINVEFNRVEGDLELKLELDGSRVVDAWASGTMYRGFEQILMGRDALDGLLITPRICGICGTAHQYAAVTALETAFGCEVAPSGTRVRNVCLAAEEIQSDTKQMFLMFTVDLFGPKYRQSAWFEEARACFEPFKGWAYKEVLQHTKQPLEIVAILGGQWPHSTYMQPGGVVAVPNRRRLLEAMAILDSYQRWYEQRILGCSSDRWLALASLADVEAWLTERPEHHDSPAGLFLRIARAIGLERLGPGSGNLLSFGVYHDPDGWQPPFSNHRALRPAGFHRAETGQIEPFDHREVVEHVKHSWFLDYDGGRHPWEGQTIPDHGTDGGKYSWAKAPRYRSTVVEVGPLAELVMAGDPLTTSLFRLQGSNAWLRQFLRLHRPVLTMQLLRRHLTYLLAETAGTYYIPPAGHPDGMGHGLLHAARGCLGHWVQIEGGKIKRYQIITPTGWNASPRDSLEHRGHLESTFVGTEVEDAEHPVELGHIIRSHDPCLVCTVHVHGKDRHQVFSV